MISCDDSFAKKVFDYYKDYYCNLGLKNYEESALNRLREDDWELHRLERLQEDLSIRISDFKRHLIVGLGTGGLAVALKELGIEEICGVEPYAPALEIARQKAERLGLPGPVFQEAIAEDLPYPDARFDFVHCFSVLEHVQDARKSIREMYRVTRPGGIIYIHTPNASWPYEGHYKVPAPVCLPGGKALTRLWLTVIGRPTGYLKGLQLYSERRLNRILKEETSLFYRVYSRQTALRHIPRRDGVRARLAGFLFHFFDRFLDIYPYQEIVIKKTGWVAF